MGSNPVGALHSYAVPVTGELDTRAALEVFEQNLEDARRMAILAGGLANFRLRSMRADGKDSLGRVLRVVKHERQLVQRVESDSAWLFLKPNSEMQPEMFSAPALEPLLRQAVVMIATAVETYVGDRVTELLAAAVAKGSPAAANERLASVVGGLASCEPSKVNSTFALVGLPDVLGAITPLDGLDVKPAKMLSEINDRRNRIAHRADWTAGRRTRIEARAVLRWVAGARAVVAAIDDHTR